MPITERAGDMLRTIPPLFHVLELFARVKHCVLGPPGQLRNVRPRQDRHPAARLADGARKDARDK